MAAAKRSRASLASFLVLMETSFSVSAGPSENGNSPGGHLVLCCPIGALDQNRRRSRATFLTRFECCHRRALRNKPVCYGPQGGFNIYL